nr:hypothetical protein [Angustibacter aerolatus]
MIVGLLVLINLVSRVMLLAAAWAATTADERGHLAVGAAAPQHALPLGPREQTLPSLRAALDRPGQHRRRCRARRHRARRRAGRRGRRPHRARPRSAPRRRLTPFRASARFAHVSPLVGGARAG